jgi:hypothetical protein
MPMDKHGVHDLRSLYKIRVNKASKWLKAVIWPHLMNVGQTEIHRYLFISQVLSENNSVVKRDTDTAIARFK